MFIIIFCAKGDTCWGANTEAPADDRTRLPSRMLRVRVPQNAPEATQAPPTVHTFTRSWTDERWTMDGCGIHTWHEAEHARTAVTTACAGLGKRICRVGCTSYSSKRKTGQFHINTDTDAADTLSVWFFVCFGLWRFFCVGRFGRRIFRA